MICSGVTVLALTTFGATARASQSPNSSAPSSLEGTWRVEVIASDCAGNERPPFWAYLTFARGGTITGTTANQAFPGTRSPDHGVWDRLGDSTYRAVTEAFILFGPASAPWAHRLDQRITMIGPDRFASEATSEFYIAAGPLPWAAAPVPSGCARAMGYRFN
jgi:hypothetical protein